VKKGAGLRSAPAASTFKSSFYTSIRLLALDMNNAKMRDLAPNRQILYNVVKFFPVF